MFFLLETKEKELLLIDEDPHRLQTILPPNDLSETKVVHPQLRQIFFGFIYKF